MEKNRKNKSRFDATPVGVAAHSRVKSKLSDDAAGAIITSGSKSTTSPVVPDIPTPEFSGNSPTIPPDTYVGLLDCAGSSASAFVSLAGTAVVGQASSNEHNLYDKMISRKQPFSGNQPCVDPAYSGPTLLSWLTRTKPLDEAAAAGLCVANVKTKANSGPKGNSAKAVVDTAVKVKNVVDKNKNHAGSRGQLTVVNRPSAAGPPAFVDELVLARPTCTDAIATNNDDIATLNNLRNLLSSPDNKCYPVSGVLGPLPDTAIAPPPAQSVTDAAPKVWSSLFSTLPRNAGAYTPRTFITHCVDGVSIPPQEVIDAGMEFWKDYLVGFFLGDDPPYYEVNRLLRQRWRISGRITMPYDNRMFFFKFSNPEDRQRILELEPVVIAGQPLIVTPWTPAVDRAREQVQSVPVWVLFTHIPSVLQSKLGINWLASLIGKLKCFDAATDKRERLVYAKALIEISPDRLLPHVLPVAPSVGDVAIVDVSYQWKPPICSTCKSFGNLFDSCMHTTTHPLPRPIEKEDIKIPIPKKIPLQRQARRQWVPKAIPTVVLESEDIPDVVIPAIPPAIPETRGPLHVGPLHVDAALVDDPATTDSIPTPVSPISDVYLDGIVWQTVEGSWYHVSFGMRYSPRDETFYCFVTDDDEETRTLNYKANGDDLVLDKDGVDTRLSLKDETWDRSMICSASSDKYAPGLYRLFHGYMEVHGPSDDDADEEDDDDTNDSEDDDDSTDCEDDDGVSSSED